MSTFQFRDFTVRQTNAALKVGTDAMVFGALVSSVNPKEILDVGAGTGVLSLMMAQKFPLANVVGVEIDEQAVLDAGFNFENSPYVSRLKVKQSDYATCKFESKFDLVISNPPFYAKALTGLDSNLNLAKHVSDLTPRVIFSKTADLLSESGSFWIIWPSGDFASLLEEADAVGLLLKTKVQIFGKPEVSKRIVGEFRFEKEAVSLSDLTIRDSSGGYTPEYISLTKDFHDREL